jgi:hypothetical protein
MHNAMKKLQLFSEDVPPLSGALRVCLAQCTQSFVFSEWI